MPSQEQIINECTKQWKTGAAQFAFYTSGTTGNPKTIYFSREQIIFSANQTKELIQLKSADKQLCCLPLDKTGGRMQLFRSLVWENEIEYVTPKVNALENYLPGLGCSIVSFTPQQLFATLQKEENILKLNTFRMVLIGGGSLLFDIPFDKFPHTEFICTYGMTETLSHFAYNIPKNNNIFYALNGTSIQKTDLGTLAVRNNITNNQWLNTNDLIELLDANSFSFLGRADNMINSGGIKIIPEEIEKIIYSQLKLPIHSFFIGAETDEILGQKVVLYFNQSLINKFPELDNIQWPNKIFKPKTIKGLANFVLNSSGKIDRIKSLTINP